MRCTYTVCKRRATMVWLPFAAELRALCWVHRMPATIAAMRRLLA